MNIEINQNTLRVTGIKDLSASSVRDLKERIVGRFSEGICNIDFDGSDLQFLDSSGLGALISMQKMANLRGGSFRLIAPTAPAVQILELTRLHRVFEIVP